MYHTVDSVHICCYHFGSIRCRRRSGQIVAGATYGYVGTSYINLLRYTHNAGSSAIASSQVYRIGAATQHVESYNTPHSLRWQCTDGGNTCRQTHSSKQVLESLIGWSKYGG